MGVLLVGVVVGDDVVLSLSFPSSSSGFNFPSLISKINFLLDKESEDIFTLIMGVKREIKSPVLGSYNN